MQIQCLCQLLIMILGQPSFDKQFARDWLKANPDNNWTLPQEIVDKTIDKYLQAYKMLTGKDL